MVRKDLSLEAHERVCEERSKSLQLQFSAVNSRLKRLEVITHWSCI